MSQDKSAISNLKHGEAADILRELKIHRYTLDADQTRHIGVIAHELRGTKLGDALIERFDGKVGVRFSDVLFLCVAAIQELQDKEKEKCRICGCALS